ncbi:MAG: hypothetical protein AABZ14_09035 [Candidatus Margulisiibacteriota bacterium]
MSTLDSFLSVNPANSLDYKTLGLSRAVETTDDGARRAFLELLLEKVFLRDMAIKNTLLGSDDNEESPLFNVKERNEFTNEIFKNKLAEQLVEIGVFDLGIGSDMSKEKK